ncbi:hypothetical protein [Amycolatopsis saalfeldensis]|uniref:hypothetical protein n=1 Tax=Amycolatopsis saalfeldensis TaxID=394193 RepID=UPI00116044AF|nr:hypothetical protein [Amycolatopsis saalfeldensis]
MDFYIGGHLVSNPFWLGTPMPELNFPFDLPRKFRLGRGYVVASSIYLSEDRLAYGEPSTIDHPELVDQVIRSGYFEG